MQSCNDSTFFVIHPVLKTYKVPGFDKKQSPSSTVNTSSSNTSTQQDGTELLIPQDNNNGSSRKSTDSQKIQKEFLIEDETKHQIQIYTLRLVTY
jgi:hypothetical protein